MDKITVILIAVVVIHYMMKATLAAVALVALYFLGKHLYNKYVNR